MADLLELTTHCIRCGFCIEACPTFTTTGRETDSPRGRIYLVRSAIEGKLRWQEDVRPHLDRCLGCLSCQTACPSGVEYGAILELAREKLEEGRPDVAKTVLLTSTTSPLILKTQLLAGKWLRGTRIPGFVSKALSGTSPEVDRPTPQMNDLPPFDESNLPPVRGEVYFLEGCAMRVLYPRVHAASRRLLRRVGFAVREVRDQGCCGAMHAHNGHLEEADQMSQQLADKLEGDLPIVVNSAGCGSWMKHRPEFGGRVVDLSEFLLAHGLIETLAQSSGVPARVTYHDACHLSHGQNITHAPRELLRAIPQLDFVELNEADTCCGSAGIYNVTQPALARQLVERKYANIAATEATIVATGNPGCHAWIAQAAREHGSVVEVLHTAELLERSFQ